MVYKACIVLLQITCLLLLRLSAGTVIVQITITESLRGTLAMVFSTCKSAEGQYELIKHSLIMYRFNSGSAF